MVGVFFDSESAIITVTLEGFEPDFARDMLAMILAESERLVNRISNQLAAEQLGFINGEIEATAIRLKLAKGQLVEFQNEFQVLDPEEQAGLVTNVIAQMAISLAEDRAELSVLSGYLDRSAPEVVTLRNRIAAKQKQIDAEKTRLTGGDKRLNAIAARFEELRFDVEFAHERYRLALMALEKAQIDASRKVKSLVVVARPNRPDEALYPDRPYILATLGAFLLMGFGVISVVVAAVREHME
jgi:capsular polysaccharide transport system permease protein